MSGSMQPWLSLFIQCAVPVFKTLATVKPNQTLSRLPAEFADNLTQTQEMLAFLGMIEQADGAEEAELAFADAGQSVQAFIQTVRWAMQQQHLDFQQWRWQQEKVLQRTLAAQHREALFKLAAEQRQTSLQLPEVHKILDHWPLRLFPSQLLDTHGNDGTKPLRIFIAPPKVQFDRLDASEKRANIPDFELSLAQHLRDFLNQSYGLHDPVRPTEFLGGAWESKRFHGEASIKALFNLLKSEPTLILESEIDGDLLNFRIAYWGIGQTRYVYQSLFKLPYRKLLTASAKNRALRWQTLREKLTALGRTPEEICKWGEENQPNLALLQEAETLALAGINLDELSLQYQLNQQDWDGLVRLLATCHCLVAGWMADIHHWRYHEASPILPEQLPKLVQAIDDANLTRQLLEKTVTLYGEILPGGEDARLAPELLLKLAHSLSRLSDQSFAKDYLHASLQVWLAHRQLSPQTTPNALTAMQGSLIPEDRPYLETLAACFTALGDDRAVDQVQESLAAIATLETTQPLPQLALCHTIQVTAGKVLAADLTTEYCQVLAGQDNSHIKAWQLPKVVNPVTNSKQTTEHQSRLLKGHRGAVLALAMSGDGRTMVSSDRTQDRSYIKIWDLSSGQLQRTLPGHRKAIHALTLSTDGQFLASGSHKIKLWHLYSGEPLRTLFGHRQQVSALATTPDTQTIISGSRDMTVKLWNRHTGKLQHTLKGHQGSVRSLAVSPDGQWLVSGSEDHTLRLWDLATGKVRHSLDAHQDTVYALAISPDGQHLVSGGADATVRIWNFSTGELLQTLTGHTTAIRALALCPKGKTLASTSEDGSLKFWQVS